MPAGKRSNVWQWMNGNPPGEDTKSIVIAFAVFVVTTLVAFGSLTKYVAELNGNLSDNRRAIEDLQHRIDGFDMEAEHVFCLVKHSGLLLRLNLSAPTTAERSASSRRPERARWSGCCKSPDWSADADRSTDHDG